MSVVFQTCWTLADVVRKWVNDSLIDYMSERGFVGFGTLLQLWRKGWELKSQSELKFPGFRKERFVPFFLVPHT